ncbi:MAG: O-antigen ligase family protein [Candidatus Saccharibacteria bacterium]|nr:O-antigen ligase family protein [Candidatus Saccharibacteria bacterium]
MEKIKQAAQTLFYGPLARIMLFGGGAIIIIAPFYTPASVWAASHIEHFDLLRIWKEVILTVLGVLAAIFIVTHWEKMQRILKDRLIGLILCYICLFVLIATYDFITRRVSREAILYGLIINLRTVSMFALIYTAKKYSKSVALSWQKIVLLPAIIVVVFGAFQMTLLPPDFLKHFGYSELTTVPYQTVDEQPGFVRVQSLLRGPNPLGAYLLVIATLLASLLLVRRSDKKKTAAILMFFVCTLFVLYGTYSRSAIIGLAFSIIALAIARGLVSLKTTLYISFAVLAIVGLAVYAGRNNDIVQNVVFHSSEASESEQSSNSQRLAALQSSLGDVISHPLGQGVGSAGPASLRNKVSPGRISENYFLQVGQEAGWVALALLITIHAVLLKRLWRMRGQTLAAALFASLVGLLFVNMLSHAWADDTLAYVWWGLAGLALTQPESLSSVILNKRKSNAHEKG